LPSANILIRAATVPEFGDMVENTPPILKLNSFVELHHPGHIGSIPLLREETISMDLE
jgi:hypothetical protein